MPLQNPGYNLNDESGAGHRSFKGETLKNRSYENPHSPIHKEREVHRTNSRGSNSSPYARGQGHVMTGMLNQADLVEAQQRTISTNQLLAQ
jgi:hypothetical protein